MKLFRKDLSGFFRLWLLLIVTILMIGICPAASAGTLVLPAGVKEIEAEAFRFDTGLEEVILPDAVESIGTRAFADSGLKKINFPANLKTIMEEAFLNDRGMSGSLILPEGITQIGKDAFGNTALFSLDIPASAVSVGEQDMPEAVYVRMRGNGSFSGADGIRFLIGQPESSAAEWAENNSVLFVPSGAVTEQDGFLYLEEKDGLVLLSAADNSRTGTEAVIPEKIGELPVKGLSAFPFDGCGTLTRVLLPESMQDAEEERLADQYPQLSAEWYPHLDFAVTRIRLNRSQGPLDETLTWTVETTGEEYVAGYDYELTLDGETIAAETGSESPSYSATIRQAGAYQLNVTAKSIYGTRAAASSQVYIAEESMKMSCPTTLENGRDLVIDIQEVEGADRYSVYVTEKESGAFVAEKTMTYPGRVTVQGFKLDAGEYRVFGYVYGNSFSYSIPTVRTVSVTGRKADGPTARLLYSEQYDYECRCGFAINAQNYSNAAIRKIWAGREETYTVGSGREIEDWFAERGTASFAVQVNGKWTDWGTPVEVTAIEREPLAVPAITMDATCPEGVDPVITIQEVEHADHIRLRIYQGNVLQAQEDFGDWVFSKTVSANGGTFTLDTFGVQIPAGTYTLIAYAEPESNIYRASEDRKLIVIQPNENRPSAPAVTADKTTAGIGSQYRFTIELDGADAYTPLITYTKPNGNLESYGYDMRSASGASATWSTSRGESYLGYVFHHSFAVRKNGCWSLPSDPVDVTIVEREKLDDAVIHVPENYRAGQNLTVSFDAVENATGYEIGLYQGERCLDSYGMTKPVEITFSGRLIDSEVRAVVTAYDNTDNYSSSTSSVTVTPVAERPAAPEAVADRTTVRNGENVEFTVGTAGADSMYIRSRYYDQNEGSWGGGSETVNVWEESTILTRRIDAYTGTVHVDYAFYTFADGVWSSPAVIRIDIESAEPNRLGTPVFTMGSSYEAGQDMPVSIEPVENAEEYYAYVRNAAGITIWSGYLTTEPRTIPGYKLNAGSYTVTATAYAEGYEESETAVRTVTISGTKPDAPEILAECETAARGRYARFMIDTEDAEQAVVRYYTVGSTSSYFDTFTPTGNATEWKRTIYSDTAAGTKFGYAFAVRKDGKWSQWSATRIVTVTDRVPLEEPQFTISETEAGQDLTVTLAGTPDATSYEVSIYQNDTRVFNNTYSSARVISVPGYRIDAGDYRVAVTVSDSTGTYASSTAEKAVSVGGGRQPGPAGVQVDRDAVLTNEYYSFTIDSAGADRIAMYSYYTYDGGGYGSGYETREVLDTETVWKTYSYYTGTAVCRFALLKNGAWTDWSDPVTVTVTADEREQLAPPSVTMDSGFQTGSDIVVGVGEVPAATSYYLYVYDSYNSTVYSSSINAESRTVTLPGYSFAAGSYTASVRASANNYVSSEGTKSFTVYGAKASAPDVSLISAEPVSDGSSYWDIHFCVNDAEAEKAVCRRWIQGETGLSYETFTEGLSDIGVRRWIYTGEVYCYSFSAYKDGRWSSWTPAIKITNESTGD